MKRSRKSGSTKITNRIIWRIGENDDDDNDNDERTAVPWRASGQLRRWPRARHNSRKWKAVMGARCICSTSAVAPFSVLVQILIFSLMANAAKPHQCHVDKCTHEYRKSADKLDSEVASDRYNCLLIRNYMECLRGTARSCRGNLNYHTLSTLLESWYNDRNCSYLDTIDEQLTPIMPTKPTQRPLPKECVYHYKPDFLTCSLFGDPHLLTFRGENQTCKVLGTWPLINNAHLVVQVTNEAVVKGSKASATNMVTVIIKGRAPCSDEKTYEAQTNNLPATFVDGTQWSGIDESVRIKEIDPGRHVEISIEYIATTIILRQVGHYLTFAIRAPREVALLDAKRDGLHLCIKGCPNTERIDHRQVLTHPKSLGGFQQMAMTKHSAEIQCKQYNLTDFYFDACVFDLMNTGDFSFSQAASEAMKDSLAFGRHPSSFNSNRTTLYVLRSPPSSASDLDELGRKFPSTSGSPCESTDVRWWLMYFLLLLFLTNR